MNIRHGNVVWHQQHPYVDNAHTRVGTSFSICVSDRKRAGYGRAGNPWNDQIFFHMGGRGLLSCRTIVD